MTISSPSLSEAPIRGGTTPPVLHRAKILHLPRSAKVIAGLVILGVFTVISVIGRWLEPYSPNQTDTAHWVRHVLVDGTGPGTAFPATYYPLPLPPSAAHWLGTTVFAQDAWSQLLASTQATLFVGLLAAAIATVLSVLVGVELAGFVGALLAIPFAGAIQVVARDVWDERRGRPKPVPTVGEDERPTTDDDGN